MNSKKKAIIIVVVALTAIGIFGNIMSRVTTDSSSPSYPSAPAVSLQVVPGDSVIDGEVLAKTVMIYLDGADLEKSSRFATRVIHDIMDSGLNTDFHNILIYTCGSDYWNDYDIPTDRDCIYLLRGGKLNLLTDYPAQNVGNGKTLETFMRYCVTNYPAQQYGLILSDHGGGPNYGVCADYRNSMDVLNMSELQNAFRAVGFGPEAKMEFIIFEACLMASAEVAFCMKDYANYMMGSENVAYAYGSDFAFIKCLDTYNSGAQIGADFVDCFYDKSTELVQRLSPNSKDFYDITYSCVDLSKIDRVEKALDALFSESNGTIFLQHMLSSSSLHARGVMEYADSYGEATDATYDLIDLADWMKSNILFEGNALMQNLVTAVEDAVVYNRASTPHMNGLSIYYPHNIKGDYSYSVFGFSDEYSKHVKMCYDESLTKSKESDWDSLTHSVTAAETPELSLKLSDVQAESFARARYYILAKYDLEGYSFSQDEYVIISSEDIFSADADNTLHAKIDLRVPVVYSKAGSDRTPFFSPLFRKTSESGETIYTTYCGLIDVPDAEVGADGLYDLSGSTENLRMDTVWLTLTAEKDSLTPAYAEKSGENGLPSRMLLDPYSYKEIEFFSPLRRVTYGSDGKPLPVSSWESVGDNLVSNFPVNDISVKLEALSEDVDYYAFTVVTDIYGNEYTTDITAL